MYATSFFGCLSLGSAIWGRVAGDIAPSGALFVSAAGAVLGILLTWHWKLPTGEDLDLAPSMHWPVPIVSQEIEHDRGPVLVTVEYRIEPKDRDEFLAAIERLARERRRDGAYAWEIFEDAAVEGRMIETFLVESWLDHLRQHERVTNADKLLQNAVHRFHTEGAPIVTHLIAAEPSAAEGPEGGR
jgi:hypothetical protein